MASVLSAVARAATHGVKVRRALISVSDKTGLEDLVSALHRNGVEILSTGGTASAIRAMGIEVTDVSEVTGAGEMLDGRVKSLHPSIHAGILAARSNESHMEQLTEANISPIDLVVVNLYPFQEAVKQSGEYEVCVENVDIGGPAMLRAAAKNHGDVVVVSSPEDYGEVVEVVREGGEVGAELRRELASRAFERSAEYDASVASFFRTKRDEEVEGGEEAVGGEDVGVSESTTPTSTSTTTTSSPTSSSPTPSSASSRCGSRSVYGGRGYVRRSGLKYGMNPHQSVALYGQSLPPLTSSASFPFEVLGGAPGYINLLDALNAWQLVCEVDQGLGKATAASFKHVSPAGVAVGEEGGLGEEFGEVFEVEGWESLSDIATAYVKARNADPMCSFGDFVAVSRPVDITLARILKPVVSDGIIAPSFDEDALKMLKKKKKGAYVILQGDTSYTPPPDEVREVFGVTLLQQRNTHVFTPQDFTNIQTHPSTSSSSSSSPSSPSSSSSPSSPLPMDDLVLASTTLKYTQSNSVGFAWGGQMVGIGAGQQSRVDCVKLAGRKAATWHMRRSAEVRNLPFLPHVKRQARINARVRFIEGDMTPVEAKAFAALFSEPITPLASLPKTSAPPPPLTLASDAFFPFRDGIDVAASFGAKVIAQPGGSIGDDAVNEAATEHGITMVHTGVRAFHH